MDGKDLELITTLRQKQWQYHAERSKYFGNRPTLNKTGELSHIPDE